MKMLSAAGLDHSVPGQWQAHLGMVRKVLIINERLTNFLRYGMRLDAACYLAYMKKIFRIPVFFILVFFFTTEIKAQARMQSQQSSNSGNYYYFPEIDIWYDISNRRFIYFENARWIFSRELSDRYRDYDVNNGYKVLVDETRPYVHANRYRDRYINYYTAYHNNLRNQAVLAGNRVYRDDQRRQPAYDANGRIQDGRIQDRQPLQTHKIPSQNLPGNDEPFDKRAVPEIKRAENKTPVENRNTEIEKATEITEPVTIEKREEPISERKPFEPGKIQPVEKADPLPVETDRRDVRIKEENRMRIEPIKKEPAPAAKEEPQKKEPAVPIKTQEPVKKEPVKTDTVPVINRNRVPMAPGGSREAQYSEKYKKQVGGGD